MTKQTGQQRIQKAFHHEFLAPISSYIKLSQTVSD